jgi:hypothetical protein
MNSHQMLVALRWALFLKSAAIRQTGRPATQAGQEACRCHAIAATAMNRLVVRAGRDDDNYNEVDARL